MSVCNVSAESSIATVVEAMLPRGGSAPDNEPWRAGEVPTKALYIKLKLSLSHYDDDGDEDHESAFIHLIFCRPTNYTKVFACVNNEWAMPGPDQWTMKSDHDSGWRSDGMRDISKTYLRCLHELRKTIGRDKGKLNISEFNTIDGIEWVQITWKDDPNDSRHRYRKLLTSISKGA